MSAPTPPQPSRAGFPQAPTNGNYQMNNNFPQYGGLPQPNQFPPAATSTFPGSAPNFPAPGQFPSYPQQATAGFPAPAPAVNGYPASFPPPQPQLTNGGVHPPHFPSSAQPAAPQHYQPQQPPGHAKGPPVGDGGAFAAYRPPSTSNAPSPFPATSMPNVPNNLPAAHHPFPATPATSSAPFPNAYPPAPQTPAYPNTHPPVPSGGYQQQPMQQPPVAQPYPQSHSQYAAPMPQANPSYGGMPGAPPMQNQVNYMQQGMQNMVVSGQSYDVVDIMAEKNVITTGFEDVPYTLPLSVANPDARMDTGVFRSTINAVPQNEELLKKSRLPFGLTLHPFRDLKNLNIIQTASIVRCRYCRTYINPYVVIPDNRHWKCNLCSRSNDLPDDFSWDPSTKTFGDPKLRPEIRYATVEFIAPSEYTLRPPQECLYVFVLDLSLPALESGYLETLSEQLLINIDQIPGDNRTLIGFVGVDTSLHFFQFISTTKLPRHMVVDDVDEPFVPTNVGILVNLQKYREAIGKFLRSLPTLFTANGFNSAGLPAVTGNCLGSALQMVHELVVDIGGRISVFQATLPTLGSGKLESREDPNNRAGKDVTHLGPASDFYKALALECTGHQVCLDLFLINSQYSDLATLSEIAKFSSGCVYHFPNFHINNEPLQVKRFERILCRYLTRKLGLEAVLRIRCSRGLAISAFYGNFFVRSTDLLSMANINPDAAVGVQINYEEKLPGNVASFQAALLYTSSKGDRRIRVHTLCLPIVSDLTTIYSSFDLKAATSLIVKMGVDRCLSGSPLTDAREATINAVVDALSAYRKTIGTGRPGIAAPRAGHLRLFPLFALAVLKHTAFSSSGRSIRLDDRAAAMLMLRFCPLDQILSEIYPQLYSVSELLAIPEPQLPQALPLSFEHISRHGIYILEAGTYLYIYVPQDADQQLLVDIFGVPYQQLDGSRFKELDNPASRRVHDFIRHISHLKAYMSPPIIVREDSPLREAFVRRLIEDRTDSSFSYYEFLKHVQQEIKA
ncbi:unnamed protein product, partial [Mesorhabditis spiculigera]